MARALCFYAGILLLTVGIEALLVRFMARRRPDRPLLVRTTVFLNLFTHPLASLLTWSRALMFGDLELIVFLAETLGYRLVARQSWLRALLFAFVTNLCTGLLGLVSWGFFWM